MKTPAVVFDLDGTLIDSLGGLFAAVNVALNDVGVPPPSKEQLGLFVGDGVVRLVHRALTGDNDGTADEAIFTRAMETFTSSYLNHCGEGSAFRLHAFETLAILRERGHLLGLLTNKPSAPTARILDHLGIASWFRWTICPEDAGIRKPDPAGLTLIVCASGENGTIMVGDSHVDCETAARAGVPFVGIRGGYNRGRDIAIEEPTPAAVISELSELPSAVERIATVVASWTPRSTS